MLSGGSTLFKDFGRRLQRDVNKLINNRIKIAAELSNAAIKPEPMKVEVSLKKPFKSSFKNSNQNLINSSLILGHLAPNAEIRCVVWRVDYWQYARICQICQD